MKKYIIPSLITLLAFIIIHISTDPLFAVFQPTKFKEYNIKKFSFSVKLPETTRISQEFFHEGDVLYSSFLHDDNLKYWGYIQIWNISDLEKFLKDSKVNSSFDFSTYDQQSIQVKSHGGYLVQWSAMLQGNPVSAKEYFIKKNDNTVLRISIFSNAENFSERLTKTVEFIIASISWQEFENQ